MDNLILRLINAAVACDARKDFVMAELLTEAIKEIENANRHTGGAPEEGSAGERVEGVPAGA